MKAIHTGRLAYINKDGNREEKDFSFVSSAITREALLETAWTMAAEESYEDGALLLDLLLVDGDEVIQPRRALSLE